MDREIQYLCNLPCVRTADTCNLKSKLEDLKSGGCDRLQVISDFDYTLTRYLDDDSQRCWSTHQLFNFSPEECGELAQQLQQLFEFYYPIEFSHQMSAEQKTPHMVEWWSKAHRIIVEARITRQQLEHMVRSSRILLRAGVSLLLDMLSDNGVPLTIFSAGIGDIIDMVLRQQLDASLLSPDRAAAHVISNKLVYDDSGVVTGFEEPLIHTFNKNGSVISESDRVVLASRPNLLLMGDTVGDAAMDCGLLVESCVLRVGFLNHSAAQLLDSYLKVYDLVIVSDADQSTPSCLSLSSSMSIPSYILQHIAA